MFCTRSAKSAVSSKAVTRGNCSVYADYRRLASGAHVRRTEGDDSPYHTY